MFDGSSWTARPIADYFDEQQNYKINIVGDDSTIMLNTDNNEVIGATITATNKFIGDLTGNVTGNVTGFHAGTFDGDLTGSVFGDDSSLIIDGVNNLVNVSLARIESIVPYNANTPVTINNNNRTPLQVVSVTTGTFGGFPLTEYISVKGTLATPQSVAANDIIGGWKISAWDAAAELGKATTIMASRLMADAVITDASPNALTSMIVAGGGSNTSSFDFYGNGEFKSPGAITPGVYADNTARDAAIPTPTAGMMVFNTTGTKFQGYTGSAWVDLN